MGRFQGFEVDIEESINSINENIGYINKIVSDLQDYTRTLTLNKTPSKIRSLFLAVIDVLKNIRTHIAVENNLTLQTDETYLKRILSNLTMNAVQAMPSGGELTLEAKTADNKAIISVIDTGVGIPADHS